MISKTPRYHDDPDARQKTEAFEIGMRVKVISPMVDFYAFRGETGTVESNSGRYLGIIVRFDEPRRFKDGHVQEWFNFNYYDLELLLTPVDADEYARVCVEAADLRRQLAQEREEWRQLAQDTQYAIEEAADLRRQLEECQAKLVKSVPLSIYKLAVRSADAEDAILLRILPDLITEAKETPPVEGDWQQRLSDL